MHTPIRSCVVCRAKRPQSELLRLVRTAQGFVPDLDKRALGRGVYICPDQNCIETKKMKRFFKAEAESLATRLQPLAKNLVVPLSFLPTHGSKRQTVMTGIMKGMKQVV